MNILSFKHIVPTEQETNLKPEKLEITFTEIKYETPDGKSWVLRSTCRYGETAILQNGNLTIPQKVSFEEI